MQKNNKKSLGRHMLLELYNCQKDMLDDQDKIEKSLVDVVKQVGATLINTTFHKFSPYGVSGVVVIAESHITIHTWPEHNYAAIDLFTCDEKIDFNLAESILVKKFNSAKHKSQTITRGEV